ncbi:MAG: AarF/UbiB family protein [Candidatus Promineifilaceae bacterium]|nr:AarF/UbiB family protein [Candidatus Promineifilaceae bacterium]
MARVSQNESLKTPDRSAAASAPAKGSYEILDERQSVGLLGRFFATFRQITGLIFGYIYSVIQEKKVEGRGWSLGVVLLRIPVIFAWPFLNRTLIKQPFPVQFRRRLEMLGPTYIKLGQILSLREDLLPRAITDELKNLLDRLPAVPYNRYIELIEESLGHPVSTMFPMIDPLPLGSASLAQTHRARLVTGEDVVIKVLKPNVRQMVINDTRWMRLVGGIAQIFIPRFQPQRLISEFCRYTVSEVDLRHEADNAEVFTANFIDETHIRFPQVYREYSSRDVLCMELFRGHKPDAALVSWMPQEDLDRVIALGIQATLEMIFRDGFFHADLHPGNLMVFDDASVGFIDLGMVGRFNSDMQKRMLSYLYSLVMGEPANAARYLMALMDAGQRSDPEGFRRAVEDLNRRWLRNPNFDEFSMGQLILQSVALAGKYRIQYPGEIILMVKALITLEGVGNVLAPGINVAEAARKDVQRILLKQLNLIKFLKDGMLLLPDVIDILNRSPLVISEGLRFLESQFKSPREGALAELRGTLFASFLLIAGAIVFAAGGPILLWGFLFISAFSIAGVSVISRR